MTKEEVDLMKQVQREATANRARLRNAHQQYKPSPYAASEGSVASRDIPILNPSMNDAANIQHPEGSKRRSSSGRLLFINSTLANKNWQQSEPSTATSVVSIGSVTSSEPSQKEENDPRNVGQIRQVYVAEPKAYWTGRYISLCDRLRMAELKRPPPSPSETNEKQIDRLFESSEKVRMNSALEELRGHCKTSEALISFEAFEGSLLKSMGISRQSLHRAGAVAYGTKVADRGLTASRTMPLAMAVSHTPVTLSSSMSRISSVNGEPAMTDASRTCYGEGNLTKSKTTGNLSSLIPIIPKRRHVIITGPASKQNSVQQISHRRQSSYFEGSPETRTKALKEREQRAARRAAEAHWRSTSQALSPDGPSSRPPSGKVLEPGEMSQPQLVSYSSSIKGSDELSYSLSATALESGHGRPPPVPTNVAPSRVELVNMASGGKEKVIKSRHKPERQFSGDRVKTFLEAGVREVRKMGRRVSGMSWPGSGEY
ncbi:hypothetical protein A1O7_04395 [Cladophialophora yegresii CBS 114405]|uniref:Uncharacterized protein n=1 Tax=Cladophialophora yegresii CBS 114405 TaxID=1182544 RepID=W9VX24_9EURO|nr:uncharacterized protein A1O7_04395 [Cladophialophora yegresii CBS 114405]EXJ60243.1 hypothetical protein A1O7_04395 [Cladophialophora yegresii CBS 114405]